MKLKLILSFAFGALALSVLPACESEHRTTTTTTSTEEEVPPPTTATTETTHTVRTY